MSVPYNQKDKLNGLRDMAVHNNSKIKLQVPYETVQMIKICNLSEIKSKSDDYVHIRLLEDYKEGRYIRRKGDLICAKYNKEKYDIIKVYPRDGDGLIYPAMVNCPKCIKKLKELGLFKV